MTSQNATNFTSDLLSLVFPSRLSPSEGFAMTMAAYFDESGTHAGAPVTVFAGFVSRPQLWVHFTREWNDALHDFGLLEKPGFFHMADYVGHRGPYEFWTDDERQKRLGRLLNIILEHVRFSIGIAVPASISANFMDRSQRDAYYFLGLWAVQQTAAMVNFIHQYVKSDINDIAYVFESVQKGHGHLKAAMEGLEGDPKYRDDFHIASFTYADKRKFFPLQAADILAYELYRDWVNVDKSPDAWRNFTKRDARYPLTKFAAIPHTWHHVVSEEPDELGGARLQMQEWDADRISRR